MSLFLLLIPLIRLLLLFGFRRFFLFRLASWFLLRLDFNFRGCLGRFHRFRSFCIFFLRLCQILTAFSCIRFHVFLSLNFCFVFTSSFLNLLRTNVDSRGFSIFVGLVSRCGKLFFTLLFLLGRRFFLRFLFPRVNLHFRFLLRFLLSTFNLRLFLFNVIHCVLSLRIFLFFVFLRIVFRFNLFLYIRFLLI